MQGPALDSWHASANQPSPARWALRKASRRLAVCRVDSIHSQFPAKIIVIHRSLAHQHSPQSWVQWYAPILTYCLLRGVWDPNHPRRHGSCHHLQSSPSIQRSTGRGLKDLNISASLARFWSAPTSFHMPIFGQQFVVTSCHSVSQTS